MLTVHKTIRATCTGFPATVDVAYLIAKDWKSSTARVRNSRGVIARVAAFMLADVLRVLVIVPLIVLLLQRRKCGPKPKRDPERSQSELLFRGPRPLTRMQGSVTFDEGPAHASSAASPVMS